MACRCTDDVLTLLIVPVLVWAGRRSGAGSLRGHLLDVAALTLSIAALVDGIARINVRRIPLHAHPGVGWFLIVIGLAFAGLWLSDIVPTIGGGLPGTINLGELPYPVCVVDLAIALPAAVATGVALVRIWAMAIALLVNGQLAGRGTVRPDDRRVRDRPVARRPRTPTTSS